MDPTALHPNAAAAASSVAGTRQRKYSRRVLGDVIFRPHSSAGASALGGWGGCEGLANNPRVPDYWRRRRLQGLRGNARRHGPSLGGLGRRSLALPFGNIPVSAAGPAAQGL